MTRAPAGEGGPRAQDPLRRGVEEALVALGQGFLAHPENHALRADLARGALPARGYFDQLVRVVYRLIFLLAAEERDLLHPDGASAAAKARYARGYSLRRLRERSVERSANDRRSDLWEATRIVFRGAATGEPRLGLPALAGIFASGQCPALDAARLENRALLLAVSKLVWLREGGSLARVNWRDVGPEQLGSVYEHLLALVPQIAKGGRRFAFASGGEVRGNARKTTGSYYTPDSLVQVLLDSALEPVIADTLARNPDRPVEALLDLAIVDPACGSGHFLLAAARRLASHVARLQARGTPSPAEYRHALRRVVGRCIYGVDLNPMAVELCKMSLWMEAVEPGLPLTFLDAHVQHGNALLGATPELMAGGIPDAAWQPIAGDDPATASALRRRNRQAAEGQRSLGPADDRRQKLVADAWCAAFVWPKRPGELADAAPTHERWRQLRDGEGRPPVLTTKIVNELAEQYRFFHWHLQFPQVLARGGFDVVLGNPPWERVKRQEQEFFASRSSEIASAANAASRKALIARLPEANAQLWAEWVQDRRRAEGESHLIRHSGRYPLCGKGDVNTYAIFAEHNGRILGPRARAGFIVPSGIATDDTTKAYFQAVTRSRALHALWELENTGFFTAGQGHMLRFALITLAGRDDPAAAADFLFQGQAVSELADPERHFTLSAEDIATINPNTGTCPIFRTQHDASIALAIYRRAGVLWRDGDAGGNPWGLRFMAMFHMANDSRLFRQRGELASAGWALDGNRFVKGGEVMLPLYEAKMTYLYNHRSGTFRGAPPGARPHRLPTPRDEQLADPRYTALPFYWVARREVEARLAGAWPRGWLLGWRDVTDARASARTVVACLVPRVAVGHKMPLALPSVDARAAAALYANLCSFPLDFAARQKVGGLSLTYFILKQLPVLHPGTFGARAPWSGDVTVCDWLLPRVLELTFTAWDLEPFARDVGYGGPPFRWDRERRFALRCELDAAFFHLYGLSRDDADHVMDTFPIVRKSDENAHGEYRTKRVLLAIYDAMAEAMRSGTAYRTRLDPPPADPRVAHPDAAEKRRRERQGTA